MFYGASQPQGYLSMPVSKHPFLHSQALNSWLKAIMSFFDPWYSSCLGSYQLFLAFLLLLPNQIVPSLFYRDGLYLVFQVGPIPYVSLNVTRYVIPSLFPGSYVGRLPTKVFGRSRFFTSFEPCSRSYYFTFFQIAGLKNPVLCVSGIAIVT